LRGQDSRKRRRKNPHQESSCDAHLFAQLSSNLRNLSALPLVPATGVSYLVETGAWHC
jgi:hypothetical protein